MTWQFQDTPALSNLNKITKNKKKTATLIRIIALLLPIIFECILVFISNSPIWIYTIFRNIFKWNIVELLLMKYLSYFFLQTMGIIKLITLASSLIFTWSDETLIIPWRIKEYQSELDPIKHIIPCARLVCWVKHKSTERKKSNMP